MRDVVRTLNPLVLIAFGLGSLVGSFAVRSLATGLIVLAAYALLMALFLPGWRFPLVCFGFAAFASTGIVYSTWRLGGRDFEVALTAGLRILVLAWPGSVAAGFIDPGRLGDHLAQTLRLPARGVAAFSAALQRLSSLTHTWNALERTRRARGFAPGRHPVAIVRHGGAMSFAMLVQAMRGASASAVAMDARGFAAAHDRTWAEPATWSGADKGAFALALALMVLPVVLTLAG